MKKIKISLYKERLLMSRDLIIEQPVCEIFVTITDMKFFEKIKEEFPFAEKLKINENTTLKNLCYSTSTFVADVTYAVLTEVFEFNERSVFSFVEE